MKFHVFACWNVQNLWNIPYSILKSQNRFIELGQTTKFYILFYLGNTYSTRTLKHATEATNSHVHCILFLNIKRIKWHTIVSYSIKKNCLFSPESLCAYIYHIYIYIYIRRMIPLYVMIFGSYVGGSVRVDLFPVSDIYTSNHILFGWEVAPGCEEWERLVRCMCWFWDKG